MILSLATDHHIVLVGADLAPLRAHGVCRQATKIQHLAIAADLNEGRASELTDRYLQCLMSVLANGPARRPGTCEREETHRMCKIALLTNSRPSVFVQPHDDEPSPRVSPKVSWLRK